jgi:hypothetical protein
LHLHKEYFSLLSNPPLRSCKELAEKFSRETLSVELMEAVASSKSLAPKYSTQIFRIFHILHFFSREIKIHFTHFLSRSGILSSGYGTNFLLMLYPDRHINRSPHHLLGPTFGKLPGKEGEEIANL